jgi:two-component system, NtrC family, nitrogen regulation sensor histidine kinase NtrY
MKVLLSLLLIFGSVILLVTFTQEQDSGESSTNVLIFLFVNINILFLLVSAFLVGREVVRLIIDRRRNILGSRLRWRLVVPFLGLTAIPLVLLFVLASGLLNQAMDGWFQNRIESSREASIYLAKSYYDELRLRIERSTKEIVKEASASELSDIKEVFEKGRKNHRLFSIALFDPSGKQLEKVASPVSAVPTFKEPPAQQDNLSKISTSGKEVIVYEGEGSRQFLRVYFPLKIKGSPFVLVSSYRIDPDITESFQMVRESYNEYRQLKLFRNPLRSGYLLTFALVAGMILFAALWLVVQIARGIVEPIERLVRGTQLISRGDYEVKIDPGGDDEVGYLITSFNQMAKELANSRHEAERQRILVESILSNLTVGVVTIDRNEHVLLSNRVAADILGCPISLQAALREIVPESIKGSIFDLLEEIKSQGRGDSYTVQSNLQEGTREFRLVITAVTIRDIEGRWIFTVLLFDDITEVVKAQQMIAWREVARRIAHEIKNPLTPLKLSAQRLQRRANREDDKVLQESTQTIVEHVESIKRLADEFSNFARMPTAEFQEVVIGTLVADVVSGYVESYNDVQFHIISDPKMPLLSLDPEQVRRVLVNLLDNAVSAVCSAVEADGITARIAVNLEYDRKKKVVKIEVSDNGIGIPEKDRHRVFDPYFTRKKGGTGLGLAIASSVVSEHQGTIRAISNVPRGTKFVIELPVVKRKEAHLQE